MALEKLALSSLDIKRFSEQKVNRYVSTPAQLQALRLATEFGGANEQELKILMRFCKYTKPAVIEQAHQFVSDAKARNKARLFVWKVAQIKKEWLQQGKNPLQEITKKPVPVKKPPAPKVIQQLDLFSSF